MSQATVQTNSSIYLGRNIQCSSYYRRQNNRIIKANYSAHIIHDTCKQGRDALNIDIETVVLKVYNHFSCSAKRREELQSYFEFADLELQDVLRHVFTRWLSLKPAADRLLLNWDAIESYFKIIEECPVF
jgi:hypothetical protein